MKIHQPNRCRRTAAFTLIEMLAVVVVIAMLAGLTLTTAGYVKRCMTTNLAKNEMAVLALALDAYKADVGYYPRTIYDHFTPNGRAESTNNWLLYRALTGPATGKKYLQLSRARIKVVAGTTLTNILDPWDTPYNYYCSPTTQWRVVNYDGVVYTNANCGFATGGQVNKVSYDLQSYGPDQTTYVPGSTAMYNGWWSSQPLSNSAVDDVTNWKR